jgi:hypothetical protein
MQRIEFNLQSAIDGAKLVAVNKITEEEISIEDFRESIGGPEKYCALFGGYATFFFDDKGCSNLDIWQLYLSVPYTEIIGNSITEPPMMTAEAWILTQPMSEKVDWSEYDFANKYGNYVADFITKNK